MRWTYAFDSSSGLSGTTHECQDVLSILKSVSVRAATCRGWKCMYCHAMSGFAPTVTCDILSTNAELNMTAYLLGLLLLVVIPADFCLISISDHKLVTATPVHKPFLQTKGLQAFNANLHG